MTRAEFVKAFAKAYNVCIQDADVWVRAFFEFLGEQCVAQPEVSIVGFGTFKQSYSPPHKYTDLHTGVVKTTEPRLNIQFSAGPKLDKAMKALPVPEEQKVDRRRKSDLPVRFNDPNSSDINIPASE